VTGTKRVLLSLQLHKDFYNLITLNRSLDRGLLMGLKETITSLVPEGILRLEDQEGSRGMNPVAHLGILDLLTGVMRGPTILDMAEISGQMTEGQILGGHLEIGLMGLRGSWAHHQGTLKWTHDLACLVLHRSPSN